MPRENEIFYSGPESEIAPELDQNDGAETRELLPSDSAETDHDAERREKLAEIGARLQSSQPSAAGEVSRELLGDFADADIASGLIHLPENDRASLDPQLKRIRKKDNFQLPAIFSGVKTATEYDSGVTNFSTRTSILQTSSGRRVFAVDCYPSSQLHRLWDGIGRHLVGHRFAKASIGKWKEVFAAKSNIPLIESPDRRTVLMPYLPNINLHDLFARSKEMTDFGECSWAEGIDLEGKKAVVDQVVDYLTELHQKQGAWGEAIIQNMIITKDQKVVICDPEMVFDKDVPEVEQLASDLYDLTFSAAGSLMKSGEVTDPQDIVSQILSRYNNPEVTAELKKFLRRKIGVLKKMLYQTFEYGRVDVKDAGDYEKIRQAILDFEFEV